MIDSQNYEGVVELFSDDAISEVGGIRLEGKDAIRTRLMKRRNDLVSRHVLTNILINVESADAASGITYLTLFRTYDETREPIQGAVQPAMVGQYNDKFVRTSQGWKIAERILVPAFVDPARVG